MTLNQLALGTALALSAAGAAAQDLLGRYDGSESVTVSSCGSYDGVSSGAWWIRLEAGGDKSVKLDGWASGGGGGSFGGRGELNGTRLTGKVSGINAHGSRWSGTLEASIDGDRLVGRNAGPVQGTSCRFVSEFETKRVN